MVDLSFLEQPGYAWIFTVECLGVIAFSISGVIVGIHRKADVGGALVFALLTSFGGGLIRDVTLGVTPPKLLVDSEYQLLAIVSIAVSLLCYSMAFIPRWAAFIGHHQNDFLLSFVDAIGLAMFCVIGVQSALRIDSSFADNRVLLILSGTITGVGGGILRDICSAQIPLIFRKHIYLIPAFGGSLLFVCLYKYIGEFSAMLISVSFTIIVRVAAIVRHWNIPTPQIEQDPTRKQRR